MPVAQASYVAGPPYPSRSPRAHPSGWTRMQGLSRRDSVITSILLDASITAIALSPAQAAAQVPKEGDSLLQKKHTVQLSTRQSEAVVKVDL